VHECSQTPTTPAGSLSGSSDGEERRLDRAFDLRGRYGDAVAGLKNLVRRGGWRLTRSGSRRPYGRAFVREQGGDKRALRDVDVVGETAAVVVDEKELSCRELLTSGKGNAAGTFPTAPGRDDDRCSRPGLKTVAQRRESNVARREVESASIITKAIPPRTGELLTNVANAARSKFPSKGAPFNAYAPHAHLPLWPAEKKTCATGSGAAGKDGPTARPAVGRQAGPGAIFAVTTTAAATAGAAALSFPAHGTRTRPSRWWIRHRRHRSDTTNLNLHDTPERSRLPKRSSRQDGPAEKPGREGLVPSGGNDSISTEINLEVVGSNPTAQLENPRQISLRKALVFPGVPIFPPFPGT